MTVTAHTVKPPEEPRARRPSRELSRRSAGGQIRAGIWSWGVSNPAWRSDLVAHHPRGRDQQHRADGRDRDRSDRMIRMEPEGAEDDAADDASHQSQQDVGERSVAVSAHQLAGQPSSNQSYDYRSDHDSTPQVSAEVS